MALLGECTLAETLGSIFTQGNLPVAILTRRSESLKDNGKAYFKTVKLPDSVIEKTIKSTRELELKGLEKALESGLERILAHVVAMLGIILSTGLAPYISVEFERSNAVQLGPYALLLAVATGLTSLFNSAPYVINAQESLKLLLSLQEHLLRKPSVEHPNQHFNPYDHLHLGLSDGTQAELSFNDILKATRGLRRWGCFVFGHGIGFLPSRDRSNRGTKTYWSHPLNVSETITVQFSRGRSQTYNRRRE